jgi:soluble cytochrome b562
MSDKQALIKEMLEMQKKFIEYEHKNGVTQQEYFTADDSHELGDYRHKYNELANKLVDMAHEEKGSHR